MSSLSSRSALADTHCLRHLSRAQILLQADARTSVAFQALAFACIVFGWA